MARGGKQQNKPAQKVHPYYDYSLLLVTLFLFCFGLVMIYSSSSFNAIRIGRSSTYFVEKQAVSGIIGIVAMLFISKCVNYRIILRKIPVLRIRIVTCFYLVCIALQLYVGIFGEELNGAKRWIQLGPFGTFQPSELSKIAVILFAAYLVEQAPMKMAKLWGFLRVCIWLSPLLALVVKENLSTAIVIAGIMITICFVGSIRKLYYIWGASGVIGVAIAVMYFVPYRRMRLQTWLNGIENDENGYQILQGLYAIASGGVFGVGLGGSMQKLGFIPEAHNDMIFTVICEELGLFGAVCVIALFIFLLCRIFLIAISAPDLLGSLICIGVMAHIAIQVIINIAVVTNSIPSTGIPLPFISYGGTSVAILLAEMGLVLSISNHIK